MRHIAIFGLIGMSFAAPVSAAEGDVAAGEKDFRKCKACHMVQSADGEDIVKGGKIGPNLWNVIGRPAASQEGFKYSDGLLALNESGLVWTVEELATFITDPNAYVKEKTGDSSAKSLMSFRLNKGQEDVAAFLASVSPDAPDAGATEGEADAEKPAE